jgi:predicted DNA-binding transcriptional regulator AlpA
MKVLDQKETAKKIGGSRPVSVRTLERWRVAGTGPKFFKLGSLVRYDEDDVNEWLAQQRRTSTSDQGQAA